MPANRDRLKPYLALLAHPGWLFFVWFGMNAGIGLLETPVRFAAPELSRVAALGVGRQVFEALNKVELVALVLSLVLLRGAGLARFVWAPVSALVLVLLTQSTWLLPALSARSLQIASGIEPPASPVHAIYAILELTKLGLLLYLGFRSLVLTRNASR